MLRHASDCTFSLRVHPTLALTRRQVIMSYLDDSGRGIALELTPSMTLRGTVGTETGPATVETASPISLHAWTGVTLIVDAASKKLILTASPLEDWAASHSARTTLTAAPALDAQSRRLSLASASDTAAIDTFNGRLEHPVLMSRQQSGADGADASTGAADAADAACIGDWDFALEMHTLANHRHRATWAPR